MLDDTHFTLRPATLLSNDNISIVGDKMKINSDKIAMKK